MKRSNILKQALITAAWTFALVLPDAAQAQADLPTAGTSEATPAPTPQQSPQAVPPRRKRGRIQRYLARLQLGVRPSYTSLISAKTRQSFGDGGFSIRPSFFRLRVPDKRHEFGPDYDFSSQKFNGNRMTMISLGVTYQHNFRVLEPENPDASDEEKASRRARLGSYPYLGVGLNGVGTKLRVPADNLDTNFKLGVGTTLTAGYQYKARVRLQASVTALSSVSDYNFSNLRVGLDYKL